MENEKREVFTRVVKAGRRTYYIDVKKMKESPELYLTITESKKKETEIEKHKIFLYKEDFEKFLEALTEAIDYAEDNGIKEDQAEPQA